MTSISPKLLAILPAALLMLGGAASAGTTINEEGTIVCAVDKWDETEKDKGHKFVDYASRCALLPNNGAEAKVAEDCVGKYEYMPDGSWKAAGTCTDNHPNGDKVFLTWEEGSALKPYTYKKTGGTGKYEGATGAGTYFYESVSETLSAGTYKGTIVLP
jgi:hypothetical protein